MVTKKGINHKRFIYSVLGALIISTLIWGSSVYAKALSVAESNKFATAFPAGEITKPTTLKKPGGGVIAAKPIDIDVNKRGILKRLLNPGVEKLAVSALTNIDSKPHRIGVELAGADFPVEMEVNSSFSWDEETKTFSEKVNPGKSVPDLTLDWYLHFPAEVRAKSIWYEGNLTVFDADTGENLTIIPVKIHTGGN